MMSALLLYALFLLAAFPAWVRGGTPPELQGPLPWLGGIILLLTLAGREANGTRCLAVRRVLRDPFLYAGLVFLVLLALQWFHAGRFLFLDPVAREWVYSLPLRPGWPYAFSRPEAAEMLRWFFPAWAAGLAIRSRILRVPDLRHLLRLLTINAAVIGVFGVLQNHFSAVRMPFTADLPVRHFASFGYENHAASYFSLMAAVALGLALCDLLSLRQTRRSGRGVLMTLIFVINLCAANFSLSRAGVVMTALLIGTGVVWFFRRCWGEMTPSGRINALAGGLATVAAVVMIALTFGGDDLTKEIRSLSTVGTETLESPHAGPVFGVRVKMFEAALAILSDNPLFGVGGWGYRYLLPYTLPEDEWGWSGRFGSANVHNDPIQFLVEFGILGALLLTLGVLLLLWPALRRNGDGDWVLWTNPLIFFCLTGAALVVIHSMIDLPFRSPAILLAWTMTLAAAGGSVKRQSMKRGALVGRPSAETES